MNEIKVKKTKNIALIILIILLIYSIVIATQIWQYSKIDDKHTADVIVVLGAKTSDDEVSPVFRERLNHGIWLYEQGYANKIILTGGYGEGNLNSDAYVAKQYVASKNVLEEDIYIEEDSTITQQNLENAKAIMDKMAYQKAIIVSDPLHMKRAMLMAQDIGIEAHSSPTLTTRYVRLKSKIPFLLREVFFYMGYQLYRIF